MKIVVNDVVGLISGRGSFVFIFDDRLLFKDDVEEHSLAVFDIVDTLTGILDLLFRGFISGVDDADEEYSVFGVDINGRLFKVTDGSCELARRFVFISVRCLLVVFARSW